VNRLTLTAACALVSVALIVGCVAEGTIRVPPGTLRLTANPMTDDNGPSWRP